jgi:hypothetical protein
VSIPKSGNENGGPYEVEPTHYTIASNNCPSSLGAGKSCSVSVTWIPTNDDLTLYPTGSLAYLQVASGSTVLGYSTMTGAAIDPTVTLSPTSYTFSPTTVTVTEAVATLTNPSSNLTALLLENLTISSGKNYFSLSTGNNSCTSYAALAPSVSCTIYVTFKPPKSGSVTGTVSIPSNATNGPLTVSLSGSE